MKSPAPAFSVIVQGIRARVRPALARIGRWGLVFVVALYTVVDEGHLAVAIGLGFASVVAFAVADAYQSWSDVPEAVAEMQLEKIRDPNPA